MFVHYGPQSWIQLFGHSWRTAGACRYLDAQVRLKGEFGRKGGREGIPPSWQSGFLEFAADRVHFRKSVQPKDSADWKSNQPPLLLLSTARTVQKVESPLFAGKLIMSEARAE